MPFAWIVIVILWAVISGISQSKRKEQAAKAKQQAAQRMPQQQPAQQKAQRQWQNGKFTAENQPDAERQVPQVKPLEQSKPAPKPVHAAPAKHHEPKPLEPHIPTPVMGEEGVGTEGIDCCHEFMLGDPETEEPGDFLPLQEETENQRAKALLQGVIYSEILGRRPVKRYASRKA